MTPTAKSKFKPATPKPTKPAMSYKTAVQMVLEKNKKGLTKEQIQVKVSNLRKGMRRQDSHTNAALDKLEEEEKIHLDSADNYVLGPAPEESEESGSEDVEVDERVAGCSSGSKHNHFLKNTIITAFCISDLQASARRQEVAEQTC